MCDGKEESYERLRPQARFGAQPPLKAAALGAKITQEGFLKVNCRRAARDGDLGHSFSIINFLKLKKVSKNLLSVAKRLFRHAGGGRMLRPPFACLGVFLRAYFRRFRRRLELSLLEKQEVRSA